VIEIFDSDNDETSLLEISQQKFIARTEEIFPPKPKKKHQSSSSLD